ncbi:MAG: hypothetical protein O2800_00420 [Planctomycetota bacterium]|nr:hypothetical protein [Planctomycetota bacterium]
MDLEDFLRHHHLSSNPFAGEEAAQDGVFARSGLAYRHPEFSRIRGDVAIPSTSLVFGEQGAGKTALRMQIAAEYEAAAAEAHSRGPLPVVLGAFDGLLDRTNGHPSAADWLDLILMESVPPLVDAVMEEPLQGAARVPVKDLRKALREEGGRPLRDLLVLQACYDRQGEASARSAALRRVLRFRGRLRTGLYLWMGIGLLILALLWSMLVDRDLFKENEAWQTLALQGIGVAVALAGSILLFRWVRREWLLWTSARRVALSCRATGRRASDFRSSFGQLRETDLARLPRGTALDERYEMIERLLRVVRVGGWRSVAVFVDRVDEPQSVAGEPSAMKALVWPIMDHAVLQFPGLAFKVFLPLDVRRLAEEEGDAFHRRARLDKQSVVERLEWSGPALYDLVMARMRACAAPGTSPPFLHELFDDSVTPQRIADLLGRIRAPRGACRFLHEVLLEHASAQASLTPQHQISAATLDSVWRRWELGLGMARGFTLQGSK